MTAAEYFRAQAIDAAIESLDEAWTRCRLGGATFHCVVGRGRTKECWPFQGAG